MFAKWVLHKVYDSPNSNYKAISFGKKLSAALFFGAVVGMKYGYETAQKYGSLFQQGLVGTTF